MPWQWYKPNQGRRVRTAAAVGCALVAALAGAEVYSLLAGFQMTGQQEHVKLAIRLGVPVLVFALLAAVALYVLNRPRLADFLIDTQGELAKVSWPTRQQVLGSTGAVLILVLLFGAYLLILDRVMVDVLLRWVLPIYGR